MYMFAWSNCFIFNILCKFALYSNIAKHVKILWRKKTEVNLLCALVYSTLYWLQFFCAFEQILFTKLHLFEWNLCLRAKFLYRILQNRRGNIIICKYCPLLNILQCISYMKTDYTQYTFHYSIFLSLLLVTFKRKVKNLLNKSNPIKSLLVRIFITSLLWSRSKKKIRSHKQRLKKFPSWNWRPEPDTSHKTKPDPEPILKIKWIWIHKKIDLDLQKNSSGSLKNQIRIRNSTPPPLPSLSPPPLTLTITQRSVQNVLHNSRCLCAKNNCIKLNKIRINPTEKWRNTED